MRFAALFGGRHVLLCPFNGVDPATTYVVLYSAFGETGTLVDAAGEDEIPDVLEGDYTTNSGFEEWAVSKALGANFISGYKWSDANGDGIWDTGEAGLGGWTISYEYETGNGGNATTFSGVVITANGTTDDFDGDGVIDAAGFYVVPIEQSNKN